MALPLDGANKGKSGSSFGRWNRAHWKAVTAIVLAVVLLVLAVISSIASLIMVLMEDDDNEGLYTETRLYVKAMTGNYMPGTKSVVNPTNKTEKPSPIEQLSVTLKPDPATFKSLSNDKTKEDAASIQFDPTDTNGLSYIVINSGGLGKLTMSTGNDAYYGIGADGKPTQHYKIIATGRMTFYDSYSYKGASDTGGTNYNLDNSSPCNAGFSDGSPLSKQKSSGSDTWHVIGFPSNADGGGNKVNSEYYTCKDHRQDNPPLLYSWSPNASSYGACLGLDTNGPGGATSIADQYFPYNKYYGKYGINKHSADDFGGSSKGGRKPMAHPEDFDMYLKNIGVANTKKARSIWDGHGNILYMLDDSGDKVNGKTRSKYLHSLTKHGKAWPTNMTGGATGTDSTPSDSDDYHKYFVESKLTDVGKEKYGAGKYNNIMPHSKKLEDIEAGTKSDPFYVNFGSTNSWTLMFWTEEVTISGGDAIVGSIDSPANLNSKGYQTPPNEFSRPQCTWYCYGRHYEVTGKKLKFSRNHDRNGGQWDDALVGKNLGSSPQPGAIMVFEGGRGGYGHVAFVEKVEDGGDTITISQAGVSFRGNIPNYKVIKRRNGTYPFGGLTFKCFIMPS